MRVKYAIGIGIWAFCILAWSAHNLEPLTDWPRRFAAALEVIKIIFLLRVAYVLLESDEEIDRLQASVKVLERLR